MAVVPLAVQDTLPLCGLSVKRCRAWEGEQKAAPAGAETAADSVAVVDAEQDHAASTTTVRMADGITEAVRSFSTTKRAANPHAQ